MARRFRLEYKKCKRQQNQEYARKIDGQKVHGVERENQADTADDSGSDRPRMSELGVDAENPKNQEHKENIRFDDAGKKFLPGRKFKWGARRIFQAEFRLRTV